MKSLREIYRIGKGPSSSHTMGPQKAAQLYLKQHPEAEAFRVTLFGSLAATGKGHMTDVAIKEVLEAQGVVEIVWKPDVFLPFHPNAMKFEVLDTQEPQKSSDDGRASSPWIVYSIGGGALSEGDHPTGILPDSPNIYPLTHLVDIQHWCDDTGRAYWEYVKEWEDDSIWDYLHEVWEAMKAAVAEPSAQGSHLLCQGTGL